MPDEPKVVTDPTTAPDPNAGPIPGTPEHDAAMQTKFDTSQGNQPAGDITPQPATKPEYIPDKFWDAEKGEARMEDFFKSYSELESKQSKGDDPKPPEGADDDPSKGKKPDGNEGTGPLTAEEVQSFNDEYLENDGKLTDATYENLEKRGYPREYVDAYIQGQEAVARESQNSLMSEAGGEDSYSRMIEWAGSNLTDEDIDAFDTAIQSGNMASARFAIQGLYAKYQNSVGTDGTTVTGDNTKSTDDVGFTSKQEMQAAMRDARYGKDPAYTNEVIRKVDKMKW